MRRAAFLLMAALVSASCANAGLRNLVAQGNRALAEGDVEEAKRLYAEAQTEAPESPLLQHNMGAALYRMGDYAAAEAAFRAATSAEESNQRAEAWYNLGNAVVRQAQAQGDPARLRETLDYYRTAVELAGDPDAKYNYEYVERLLKEMASQQQQGQGSSDDEGEEEQQEEQQEGQQPQAQGAEEQQEGEEGQQETEEQEGQQPQAAGEEEQQAAEEQAEAGEEGEQGEDEGAGEAAEVRKMSPEEAERLLEMLDEEGEALPTAPPPRTGRQQPVDKDW